MRKIRDLPVCVVGGAGFLGSHLVNHLIDDRGCQVLVIDNLSVGRREFIHPKAKFEHADITQSEEHLYNLFGENGIKYVFNYAAFPYVPMSFSRPVHVFNLNAMGAMRVINAADQACVRGILQVSSAELYGGTASADDPLTRPNVEGCKIDETFPIAPHSSYGASKAAIDYYCQCAFKERKTPVIALRQFNCIGERETHPYVVPEIISQLVAQTRVLPHGKYSDVTGLNMIGEVHLGNNSFRDFMYAGDAVRIAVELLERGEFGEVYNLGSETGIKIYDLAKLIGKVMGFADVQVEEDEERVRPWEIWHLQSDNAKLWNALGQTYVHDDLESAVEKTVAWFNDNGRKWPWQNS